jgi:hypothetical protein
MKGRVYAIRSHQTIDIYIGSTTQTLSLRMGGHRRDYKRQYNNLTSFHIVKYDDAYIELLEEVECNTKEELHAREGHYIRTLNCVNKCMTGRTDKQWREDNKEQQKEYNALRYKDNKEERQEQARLHYKENSEHAREQKKINRETNAEQIKAKKSQKYTCDCGKIICHGAKARHIKSIKHQTFLLE